MELSYDILAKILTRQNIKLICDLNKVNQIAEQECYKALKQIQAIIRDDSLNDQECFAKIEEIVCVFERFGSDGGTCHDFG